MSYSAPPGGPPDHFFITAQGRNGFGELSIGLGGSTLVSQAWATANLALFVPFGISGRRTYVRAAVANAATINGNFDIGVYNLTGNRLFSTGTTAHAGASAMQKITINWTLDPGLYYLAMSCSSATATFIGDPPNSTATRSAGMKQMASAFVLPATATLAANSTSRMPLFGIFEKTWL